MRERGLKPMIVRKVDNILEVAPHAGAWIETFTRQEEAPVKPVAPHAGAWIETNCGLQLQTILSVAPHAGAWIETKHEHCH